MWSVNFASRAFLVSSFRAKRRGDPEPGALFPVARFRGNDGGRSTRKIELDKVRVAPRLRSEGQPGDHPSWRDVRLAFSNFSFHQTKFLIIIHRPLKSFSRRVREEFHSLGGISSLPRQWMLTGKISRAPEASRQGARRPMSERATKRRGALRFGDAGLQRGSSALSCLIRCVGPKRRPCGSGNAECSFPGSGFSPRFAGDDGLPGESQEQNGHDIPTGIMGEQRCAQFGGKVWRFRKIFNWP